MTHKWNATSFFWVAIAFLFGAARLFEEGLSLDPAVYSTMARNFAEKGGWDLGVGKYFFPNYPDHPYLFAWIQGFYFRFFGATDFTARVPSLLMGMGTIFFLHQFLRRNFGDLLANLICFLTMVSPPIVGRFATPYLEPTYFFFFLASLDIFDRGIAKNEFGWMLLSALLFVAAFFTKGIALLPGLAFICYWGYVQKRALQAVLLWGGLTVICGVGAMAIQTIFSEYPFWENYFALAFGKRARQSNHFFVDQFNFMVLVARLHPLHVLLALAGLGGAVSRRESRPLFLAGLAGFLLFAVANGMLARTYHHYTYPSLYFVNWMAGVGAVWLLERKDGLARLDPDRLKKWALRLGIAYQILWNVLPFPMRRKPIPDFFQLRPKVAAMKAVGLEELQGHALTDIEWMYPTMSLWYWRTDTRHLDTVAQFQSGALLTPKEVSFPEGAKAKLCATGENYRLWTSENLHKVCLEAHPTKWGQ